MKLHNYLVRPKFLNRDITAHTQQTSYYVTEFMSLCSFPGGDGTGQKIGIIELGGGYVLSDIQNILTQQSISIAKLSITAVPVDGATNNPGPDQDGSQEVTLDTSVIASCCPAATIRVYFAPNVDQSFINAVAQAGLNDKDGCKIISISWGGRESEWDPSLLDQFNNLLQTLANQGVTVFCASGDSGSGDGGSGLNVDFPASSPFAVGCGGTSLTAQNDQRVF